MFSRFSTKFKPIINNITTNCKSKISQLSYHSNSYNSNFSLLKSNKKLLLLSATTALTATTLVSYYHNNNNNNNNLLHAAGEETTNPVKSSEPQHVHTHSEALNLDGKIVFEDFAIFSGRANPELAQEIADRLGVRIAQQLFLWPILLMIDWKLTTKIKYIAIIDNFDLNRYH
jgi:hypothetical protein